MSADNYPPALIADLRARYPAICAVVRAIILEELRTGELANQVRVESVAAGGGQRMSLAAARFEAQLGGQIPTAGT